MNPILKTETPALITLMEHWAKTITKNGGVAAVTIQEGADRLRELQARAEKAEKQFKILNETMQHVTVMYDNAMVRAEKAEANVERLTKHCSALEIEVAVLSEGLSEDHAIYVATARAEKAEAEVERLKGYCEQLHTIIDNNGFPSGTDYAKMTARAEKAEADTARMDWLEKEALEDWGIRSINRAAIDAAMKESSK